MLCTCDVQMAEFHTDQSVIRHLRRSEGYGLMHIIKLNTSEIHLWYGSVFCAEKIDGRSWCS